MPVTFNAVIWAAVSTRPQAVRDVSLPDQVARARAWLVSRGYTEAHEPLIVPGESRQTLVSLSDAEIAIPQFKQLLDAAQTEDALTGAAVNAGQWMEYYASEESTRLATQREQRRLKAAADPKVRDTPQGGVMGGGMDEVTRIKTMPREDFFKMKKEQLRQARLAA